MKLIQILALTTAMAAMASGQSTGATNAKSSGQQPGAAPAKSPAVAAIPAAAGKLTPAAKKAASAAHAKSVPAKAAGKQAVAAKPSGNASAQATKPGAAPAKPVVTTGSLPAKGKPGASASKNVPAVQAAAAKSPAKAVTKPPAKAKPAAKPAAPVVARKSGSKQNAASKPAKPTVAKVEGAPKEEPKPRTPAKLLGAAGRRDPFVSPIRSASAVSPTASCTSGKRCLSIPELVLHGTVRDISGKMMAVVSTSNRRTYTLRENDQVFNGSVEKITSDSIIFREYVKDPLGRETAREVVKKMGPTS